MIALCPAKINLGLHILNKRPDLFHNIDSYFYPVPLYDLLEIVENTHSSSDEFQATGIIATQSFEENLIHKAIQLVRRSFSIPALQIHLHKQIPFQAGLGGGSSNAVSAISILNSLFKLNISPTIFHQMALELGSDCPFFIQAIPARVGGRGEIVTPVNLNLSDKYIAIVKPLLSVKTSSAFQTIVPRVQSLPQLSSLQFNDFQTHLSNQFEESIGAQISDILVIKKKLIEQGAFMASLTGSGSAVYGLFHSMPKISFSESYFIWIGKLQ